MKNIDSRGQKTGISLMALSSLCVCFGQMFWKLYATGTVIQLLLGFLFYGVGAIVMLIAYRYGKLSVLQPMLSLNYIFAIIIAWAVLNEPITSIKIVGIVIIVAGVVLIGGDRD